MESAAKTPDVFRGELSFSGENLRDNAGRPEYIEKVFLFEIICQHEFVQDLYRFCRLERVMLLFEIFDQQLQKLYHAAFRGRMFPLSQQRFKNRRVALVLLFCVNDAR